MNCATRSGNEQAPGAASAAPAPRVATAGSEAAPASIARRVVRWEDIEHSPVGECTARRNAAQIFGRIRVGHDAPVLGALWQVAAGRLHARPLRNYTRVLSRSPNL